MIKDGGQCTATSDGAMLADPAALGKLASPGETPAGAPISHGMALTKGPDAMFFDPAYWAGRSELTDVTGGRGSAWFISSTPFACFLRHYRRGGWIARLVTDRYVWVGETRVRAFAEWRLLHHLFERGLPVPAPVAARYQRQGLWYRCDLITRRIGGAETVSTLLARGPLDAGTWHAIGAAIARLHAAGADHADLNAHNILLDEQGTVSVIDFDRGRLRGAGSWMRRNLLRLRRSLVKITRGMPADRYSETAWDLLMLGYASVLRGPLR